MPTPVQRFGVRHIVASAFYHRRAEIIGFAIPSAAALVVALMAHTTYVAEARLLVLPGGEYTYRPQVGQTTTEASLNNPQIVQSEVEILSDNSLLAHALQTLGPNAVLPGYDPDAPNALARAVRSVSQGLKIQTAPLSNAITVSFSNPNPITAAQFVNTLIKLYLQQRPEVYQRTSYVSLPEQRKQISDRLQEAETALTQFADEHRISNLDDQTSLLLRQQIDTGQEQRAAAAKIDDMGAQLAQLRQELVHMPRMAVQYSEQGRTPLADQGGRDLAALEAKRQSMAAGYQPGSAPLRDLDSQIANLRGQIRGNPAQEASSGRSGPNPLYDTIAARVASLEADRRGQEAALASLQQTNQQLQARLVELNVAGQQYRSLRRDRDVLEHTLDTFARSSEEAQLNQALERSQEANVRVVQEAQPPPNGTSTRMLIVLAGLVMGVVCAISSLLVLSGTRQVVIDAADAERRLQLPVLITVAQGRTTGRMAGRTAKRPSARAPIAIRGGSRVV